MTWFETQQIDDYITGLENALDEWTLNRIDLQVEQAELSRLGEKLNGEIFSDTQPPRKNLLFELFNRIQQCQISIAERLKF